MEEELKYDEILKAASLAGKIILESGGEIYRVEQTIDHICRAYGIPECESYATPTTIILSIVGKNGKTYSLLRRITERRVDLSRVEAINSLSRRVSSEKIDLSVTEQQLLNIQNRPIYSFWKMLLASAIGAGAFSVIFGKGIREFVCAAAVGAALHAFVQVLTFLKLGDFFIKMAGGAFSALLGWLFYYIGVSNDWKVVTLSVLMLLVPGMLFTNAFRDIAAGDLVSGVSRVIEAVCTAAALACGAAIVYIFLLPLGGFSI